MSCTEYHFVGDTTTMELITLAPVPIMLLTAHMYKGTHKFI